MDVTETIVIDSDDDILFICETSPKKETKKPQENWRTWKQTTDNRQPKPFQPNTLRCPTPSITPERLAYTTHNTSRSPITTPRATFVSKINQNNPLVLTLKKAGSSGVTPKRIATVQPCKQPQPEVKTIYDNNEGFKKKPKLESQSIPSCSGYIDTNRKDVEVELYNKKSFVMIPRLSEKTLLPYRQKLKESTQSVSKNGVVKPPPAKKRCSLITLDKKASQESSSGAKPKSSRGTEPQACEKKNPLEVESELKKKENESNRTYIERLISELIKVSAKGKFGKEYPSIKRKFEKSKKEACDETMNDPSVAEFLERAIFDIDSIVKQTKYDFTEKLRVADKIKHCISKINQGSAKTSKKLNKLYVLYGKLTRSIKKLEELEVSSDEEFENPYLTLDKYRVRATEVYKKICFLEGRSSIANRDIHQQFIYTGNISAPKTVIKALEKHYNKTKLFPNWLDTYKLFQKVVLEQKLKYTDSQIYSECKELFQDFGKQLQKRRQRDDYINIIGYLEDDHSNYVRDPAENDPDLLEKLSRNREDFRKKEANILDEFAFRSEKEEDEMKELEEEKNIDCSGDEGSTELNTFLTCSDSD